MPNPRDEEHLRETKVAGLDKTSRLADFADHHSIVIRCRCGRYNEFRNRALERKHGVPPETSIEELGLRLRCSQCGAHGPFRVSWVDDQTRGTLECKEHLLIVGWRH